MLLLLISHLEFLLLQERKPTHLLPRLCLTPLVLSFRLVIT
jgi:hypothetical protein